MTDKRCLIIFSSDLLPLGEVWFEDEVFSHVMLGDEGDEELGPWIEEWQTQGLDHMADEQSGLAARRLNMRADNFSDALDDWLESQGYVSLNLPERAIPTWHLMQSAYEDPQERFNKVVQLRDQDNEDGIDWDGQHQILVVQIMGNTEEEPVKKKQTKKAKPKKSVKSIKSVKTVKHASSKVGGSKKTSRLKRSKAKKQKRK